MIRKALVDFPKYDQSHMSATSYEKFVPGASPKKHCSDLKSALSSFSHSRDMRKYYRCFHFWNCSPILKETLIRQKVNPSSAIYHPETANKRYRLQIVLLLKAWVHSVRQRYQTIAALILLQEVVPFNPEDT